MPTHSGYKFQPDSFTRIAAARDLQWQQDEPYRTLDESMQAAMEGYLSIRDSWAMVTTVMIVSTALLALVPIFGLS